MFLIFQSKHKITLAVIFGVVLVAVLVALFFSWSSKPLPLFVQDFLQEYDYPIQDDDVILHGPFNNVFIGEIIRQVGNEDVVMELGAKDRVVGAKQYEVQVLDNIRGIRVGRVVVNVRGGCNANGECIILGGIDDTPLPLGGIYVFPTRYDKEKSWHTVAAFLQETQ